MVMICFHCQWFGRISRKCPAKEKEEDPACAKCAGNHNMRDCTYTGRYKKVDLENAANDVKCCKVLEEELQNIRCSTENGYLVAET